MGLSDNEKAEAKSVIALALELNEPETMLEGLRRACEKKAQESLMSDSERDRWKAAGQALASVANELERSNQPQSKAEKANFPAGQSQHTNSQDIQSD